MTPAILEFRGAIAKLLLLTVTFLLPILSIPTAEFELSHGLRFDSLSTESTREGRPKPQPPTVNCFARCIAMCASGSDVEELKQCEGDCHKYSQVELCKDVSEAFHTSLVDIVILRHTTRLFPSVGHNVETLVFPTWTT